MESYWEVEINVILKYLFLIFQTILTTQKFCHRSIHIWGRKHFWINPFNQKFFGHRTWPIIS